MRKRLHNAAETVSHSLGYARHLLRGNRIAGDLSWVQPGTRPVVLLHGFLGTRGTMQPLTRRFQADGRVVFSYHHGTFQLGSLRASSEELIHRLRDLVENLELDRVDVLGFSMGGLVALHAVKFMQGARWIRRLVLLGNTDLLQPRQIKPEQRDFMRTLVGWMTDREELRGLGSRHDLTVKLNLDRNALGILELLTNIGLPLLALLIALIIWNTRRH